MVQLLKQGAIYLNKRCAEINEQFGLSLKTDWEEGDKCDYPITMLWMDVEPYKADKNLIVKRFDMKDKVIKARQVVEKIGLGNAYMRLISFVSDKDFELFYKEVLEGNNDLI